MFVSKKRYDAMLKQSDEFVDELIKDIVSLQRTIDDLKKPAKKVAKKTTVKKKESK